jgi:hypothetical protein
MQNRNNLTPGQVAYLQLLVLRTRPLSALEFATFLKLLDLETLNRFIAICEQRKKREQRIQQIMQEIRQQARQKKQKRKPAPKRCTIAQAWEKRRLERLRVKKKLTTIEIDTTCIADSNSTNRHSALMCEHVNDSLKQYFRSQN